MKKILPTLQQFKAEAKALKKQDPSIKNHSQALDHHAQHYGYKNFQTVRSLLSFESKENSIAYVNATRWENPFKGLQAGQGIVTIKSKSIEERTLDIYKDIDWGKIKNTKVLSETLDNIPGAIATLEIRGKEHRLLHYDYYLLLAIELSDAFDVDFDFVYDLRTAIREDINHFVGPLLDTLYSYEVYSLDALKIFNEFYDEYHKPEGGEFFEIEIYIQRLENILDELNYARS